MTTTLLLDRTAWDLALDANGNMAVASEPYSIVQDVASACRLFYNELYFGPPKGVHYFEGVLGKFSPDQFLKSELQKAALSVPGVLTAQVYLAAPVGRNLVGQVQITTATGPYVVKL